MTYVVSVIYVCQKLSENNIFVTRRPVEVEYKSTEIRQCYIETRIL